MVRGIREWRWVLEESFIQKLSVFERKILKKIFGSTIEDNGIWTIKTNKELDELTFRRRIKSRLPFAGIIRRLPYSTRFQDKG